MSAIPEDRCERCTAELGEVWRAGDVPRADGLVGDRVCGVCVYRAHERGETVVRVDPPHRPDCPHCHGRPLEPARLPDHRLLAGRCAVCSPPA